MLSPYNVLYPNRYSVIKDDEYTKLAEKILTYSESMILYNHENLKLGRYMAPLFLIDKNDDEFELCNCFGEPIDGTVVSISGDSGWQDVSYTNPIQKTDALYSKKGSTVYCIVEVEPVYVANTISGNISTDMLLTKKDMLERYIDIISLRVGAYAPREDVTVDAFDSSTGVVTLSGKDVTLLYPDNFQFSVGDNIVAGTVVDRPVSATIENSYIVFQIKEKYKHIAQLLTIDANKKITIV